MRSTGHIIRAAVLALLAAQPAFAQQPPAKDQPDVTSNRRSVLRVLTSTDYPPFNYADETGQLTGFNIDFARTLCVELEVSCDIKPIAWDDLLPTLERGDADAAIASIGITPSTIAVADFTRPYFFMTGRFAVRKSETPLEISPIGLEARKIAVTAGTAHEAYLKAFFLDSQIAAYDTPETAHAALAKGDADAIFGDSLAMAFWINGTSSNGCCELAGEPYADERYFGSGVHVAVRRGDVPLRRQIDEAIIRIRASQRYEELLSRYFPVRLF